MNGREDYFPHLLQSLQGQDGPAALRLLEEAARAHPGDARLLLLLGAQLMHARQVDAAEGAYIHALQLAPDLAIARFQLGLLQLTSGRPAAASATWSALDALPEDEPLRMFKTGLELVAQDRFEEARRMLVEGIARNRTNPALNRDMELVLRRIAPADPASSNGADAPQPDAAAAHFLVSTYGRKE